MKLLILLLITLTTTFASAGTIPKEIRTRMDQFFSPLMVEFAQGFVDASLSDLGVKDAEDIATKLKKDLQKFGPIRKVSLTKYHEGVGARIVRVTYKIQYKKGSFRVLEVTFLKQFESAYEVYDAEIR